MPYSMSDISGLPAVVKNKPALQQEAFVKAFNLSLEKGRTEDESFLAGLGAAKVVARSSSTVVRKDYRAEERKLPSHIPSLEQYQAIKKAEAIASQPQELQKLVIPAFLAKHILPDGDRSVKAMNFDTKGQLVTLFNTGEKITTDAVAIKEFVEQYVSVTMSRNIAVGNAISIQYALSGFSATILQTTHLLTSISSYYVLNNTGSDVLLEINIDSNKNITVSGLIPLDNFTLYLTGIKS